MKKYEKNYIDTLKRMDSSTLAQYMAAYIKRAVTLQEELNSTVLEIDMMQGILMKKLEKEKK